MISREDNTTVDARSQTPAPNPKPPRHGPKEDTKNTEQDLSSRERERGPHTALRHKSADIHAALHSSMSIARRVHKVVSVVVTPQE